MINIDNLDIILDLVSDGIVITDSNCKIVKANKAYQSLSKLSLDQLIGMDISEMENWSINPNESCTVKVLESKKPVTIIQKVENEDGKKELITTGMPLFNENNEIIYVVNSVRDITLLNELKRSLENIKRINRNYEEELKRLKEKEFNLKGLVANSKSMLEVLDAATKVASVDSPVMLRGESGVGKEVIAKYIHKTSKRSGKQFVKVNSAAIPENLIESEFFGYEPGAFTGASKHGKIGYFELANHGTLFLDEIGDMPMDLQVKLLRVLEEQEFRRVGGVKTIKTDVRIIAATNRNLEKMVEENKFRKDLYYRLQVYPIEIPPLRERKEDIPLLIHKFLEDYQKKHHVHIRISSDVVQLLCQYDWPGNIRELMNVVERMAITSSNNEILLEHVPEELLENTNFAAPKTLKEEVELFEYNKIRRALSLHKTTRRAARALGISQPTLVRKMKYYESKYHPDSKVDRFL